MHPGRLVRGLARVVERQGAQIAEQTAVVAIDARRVRTDQGTVRADVVVRATEGYTDSVPTERRGLVPLWSLVVATEPLPAEVWQALGWQERETLTDARHVIVYAQRNADDRIVLGGRGVPYRFGSGTDGARGHARTFAHLAREVRELFPAAGGARLTHRWGGVLGVPRDWQPSVGLDPATGFAWAGGYVGDGVACSALAGRTLAELITGQDTELTALPWVNHRSRRWEPEPLRWLGIRAVAAGLTLADRAEGRTGRPSRLAAAAERLLGE